MTSIIVHFQIFCTILWLIEIELQQQKNDKTRETKTEIRRLSQIGSERTNNRNKLFNKRNTTIAT